MQNFQDFGLPPMLLEALTRFQYLSPTPIQEKAIPLVLKGKNVLGSAQTGTGKTGAFVIPLMAKMMETQDDSALVLAPTRELATQILDLAQKLIGKHIFMPTALLIGGDSLGKQFKQLQGRPRLIIGTPGRVNDHLRRGTLKVHKTNFLVLDEMDRMLDMGFGIQIDDIVKHLPKQRQTLMFSATVPANIEKLAEKYMHHFDRISVGSTVKPSANIQQEIIQTSDAEKYQNLVKKLEEMTGTTIIFVKTKFGADRLSDKLFKAGHESQAIHGDLKQSKRERVLKGFRNKEYKILVATDVASRGLDIPHIECVINYDLPQLPEDYIHRIGRTGRAGSKGLAICFLSPSDQSKWRAIHKLINSGEPNQFEHELMDDDDQGREKKKSSPYRRPQSGKGFFQKTKSHTREERPSSHRGDDFRKDRSFSGPPKKEGKLFGWFRKKNDESQDRTGAEHKRREYGAKENDRGSHFQKKEYSSSDRPKRDYRPSNRGEEGFSGERPRGAFQKKRSFGAPRPQGDGPRSRPSFGAKKPWRPKNPQTASTQARKKKPFKR